MTVGQLAGCVLHNATIQIMEDSLRKSKAFLINNVMEFELGMGMHRTHEGKFEPHDVKTKVVLVHSSLKQKVVVAAVMRTECPSAPRNDHSPGVQFRFVPDVCD